jgi:hypothetical protein
LDFAFEYMHFFASQFLCNGRPGNVLSMLARGQSVLGFFALKNDLAIFWARCCAHKQFT